MMNKVYFTILLLILSLQGQAAIIRFVAPEKAGQGSGESNTNAADFLDNKFWAEVQALLKKEPVVVKFLPGDYVRAYTEKPLLLHEMGHGKQVLTLEGEAGKTIFTAPTGHQDKSVMIEIKDSQNMVVRNLSFTGNGKIGYVLRITSSKEGSTKNIFIENCTWTDMRGIIYGATGCHQPGTQNITYTNCTFKRIGIDSHSHHMYHAHGATNINVLNSYFEDCTGDYVRFRDNCQNITVKNSTFNRNPDFPAYPFISMPLFNNVNPGDEKFSSNFTFTGNTFTNAKYAIAFHHYGYSSPGFSYLLTSEEGNILQNGSASEKGKIMKTHFGIDATKIYISKNKYTNITTPVGMGTFARYGATTKGFDGWGDISMLFPENR